MESYQSPPAGVQLLDSCNHTGCQIIIHNQQSAHVHVDFCICACTAVWATDTQQRICAYTVTLDCHCMHVELFEAAISGGHAQECIAKLCCLGALLLHAIAEMQKSGC